MRNAYRKRSLSQRGEITRTLAQCLGTWSPRARYSGELPRSEDIDYLTGTVALLEQTIGANHPEVITRS